MLTHPICNLAFGERLYYLLITVQSGLFEMESQILETLEKTGLDQTSCAYFVFGESDILIRLWACESDLKDFQRKLKAISNSIQLKTYLITNQDTWYQREIEERLGWYEWLFPEKLTVMLKSGEVPEELRFSMESRVEKQKEKPTKFFVFIEEPFGRKSDVFRLLQRDIRLSKPELLKGIDRLSLYSFATDKFRGVLIKGEAEEYHAVSEQLVHFAKNLKVKEFAAATTTYFCAKTIKFEQGEIAPNSRRHAHRRKADLTYNLLKAHDCFEEQWESDAKTRIRSKAFNEIVSTYYQDLFVQHKFWFSQISELRKIYRWIVRAHDENLRGFLINQYIGLEKYFRDLFSNHPELWRDESKIYPLVKKLSPLVLVEETKLLDAYRVVTQESRRDEFTLGSLRLCARAAKDILANDEHNQVIDKFCKVLEDNPQGTPGVIRNRNDLMHGKVTSLFDDTNDLWPDFVENYIQLKLLLPRVQLHFENALQQDEKLKLIKERRNRTR